MNFVDKLYGYFKVAYLTDHFPSVFELLFSRKKVFVYYGYLGDGNFGDELVFEAAKKLFSPGLLLPFRRHMPIHLKLYCLLYKKRFSGLIIGGGTLIGPLFWEKEYYLKLVELGIPIYVHGTGVHKRDVFNDGWRRVFDANIFGGVRGPLSVENSRVFTDKAEITGDAAFVMLDRETVMSSTSANKTLLVNLGTHANYAGREVSRKGLHDFIVKSIDAGFIINFLPFHEIDLEIAKELKTKFPQITILNIPRRYAEGITHFKNATFAIGERLHFTVMAVLAGCPFVSINYAKKHEDLLNSIELSSAGIAPQQVTLDTLTDAFEKSGSFDWSTIAERLDKLKEKQMAAFENFAKNITH